MARGRRGAASGHREAKVKTREAARHSQEIEKERPEGAHSAGADEIPAYRRYYTIVLLFVK